MAEQGSSSKCIEPAKKNFKKYHQKFLPSYTKDFPCIISTEHARCVPCELDFKISHGGLDDVSRHCSSARHIEKSAALKNASNIHFHFENKKNIGETLRVLEHVKNNLTDKFWILLTNLQNLTAKSYRGSAPLNTSVFGTWSFQVITRILLRLCR